MASPKPSLKDPGIVLVTTYFILLAVNSLILYLANRWFPQYVVLGTQSLSLGWSILHSMGTLAMLNTFTIPFINRFHQQRNQPLTSKDWLLIYFVINFVGVWLVSRFSEQFGLGITSWIVAALLALALDAAQGIAMMQLEKRRTN